MSMYEETPEVQGLRQKLSANGYQPIPVIGKKPAVEEWTSGEITSERIAAEAREYPYALSTGLRTGALVGVDIDVISPEHATDIRGLVERELGPTPFVRVGKKGFLLCYRNAEPVGKVTVACKDKDRTKVELLGQGQQFVAYGVHPDTGARYRWTGDAEPLTHGFDAVPEVTPAQLRQLAERVAAKLGELGYPGAHVTGDVERSEPRAPAAVARDLPALPPDEIRARLYACDPDLPYDQWRDILAALGATPCSDPDFDPVELGIEWSLSGKRGYKDDQAEAARTVFRTMPPKEGGIGAGSFIRLTNEAGYRGPTVGKNDRPLAEWGARHVNADAAGAVEAPEREKRHRFPVLLPADMLALPEPSYVVDGIIPERGIVLIYGEQETGKSFVVLDLLASNAAGQCALHAFDVAGGPTVHCAAEAPNGEAKLRWPAFVQARGIKKPLDVPFALVPAVPLVRDPGPVKDLIEDIKEKRIKPRIVAIDTVARAEAGLNENDAATAALMIGAAEEMRDAFDCAVILVHHEGKNHSNGARGSSALLAGCDAAWEVTREGDRGAKLHCVKMKDADHPADIHLAGEVVYLGYADAKGRPVTSLAFRVATDAEVRAVRGKSTAGAEADQEHKDVVAVRAALEQFGARQRDERYVTSSVLATELIPPQRQGETVEDFKRRVENEVKRLQALARPRRKGPKKGEPGPLAQFVERGNDGKPVDPIHWWLPDHGSVALDVAAE